ncbi:unnamed protein product [Meloidogyne enterolobii]|uniref:Uncharacterized protein n=1 Tax=Meloidogyne enterolobii TaxID=390850 RepID=A0ACB0Z533_MELEN
MFLLNNCFVLFLFILFVPFLNAEKEVVGYGSHTKEGEKITKMGVAQRIVNKNEDLEGYGNVENACNVSIDDGGNIILHYTKEGTIKEKGCVVDMLTTEKWSDRFEFVATVMNDPEELGKCLKPKLESGMNENTLPFAFSINLNIFKELLKGPQHNYGSCAFCDVVKDKCMERTGLEFAWSIHERVNVHMGPIGEPKEWDKRHSKDVPSNKQSEIKVTIEEEKWFKIDEPKLEYEGDRVKENPKCYKKEDRIKPKAWEIIGGKYEGGFNYLFVFYLLPQKATFKHSCYDGSCKGIIKESPNGPNCKEIQIKFNGSNYKLLMNGENVDLPTTLNISTSLSTTNIPINSTNIQTTNILTTKEEEGGSAKWLLIGGIGGSILIILIIGGVILFILMISKNNKEGNNEETKGESNVVRGMSTTNVGMTTTTTKNTTKGGKTTTTTTKKNEESKGGEGGGKSTKNISNVSKK